MENITVTALEIWQGERDTCFPWLESYDIMSPCIELMFDDPAKNTNCKARKS